MLEKQTNIKKEIESLINDLPETTSDLTESCSGFLHKQKEKELIKSHHLIGLIGITMLTNFAYAIIVPFIPLELAAKQVQLSVIGLAFAVYHISEVICIPFTSKIILALRKRNVLRLGLIITGSSLIAYG